MSSIGASTFTVGVSSTGDTFSLTGVSARSSVLTGVLIGCTGSFTGSLFRSSLLVLGVSIFLNGI